MTLRWRLTVYWALVISAILAVAGSLILFLFSRAQWGRLDRALIEEGDTCANALAHSTAAQARAILSHLSAEKDLGPGRRVRLLIGDRVWFDQGDQKTELPAALPAGRADAVIDGGQGRYRFALVPLKFDGQAAWLQNGIDATALRSTIAHLRRTLILVLPIILLLCVTGGYLLSAWALAPVSALAAALERIGARDLKQRLAGPTTNDEIGSLVDSINHLLNRLEQAVTAQRQFVSEAAHELRTPLAVLRSGLEVALHPPFHAAQSRVALIDALAEVERLCTIAEDLLALARMELAPAAVHEAIDITELAAGAGRRMQPLADSKRLRLRVTSDGPLIVRGSKSEISRVILNVLDNAIKFTPERGTIRLDAGREGTAARLVVSDSGPGIAPAELSRVFDPFFTSPNNGAAGSGLGLALCRRIISLHGGTIDARNRAEGGCEIEIRLPVLPDINVR